MSSSQSTVAKLYASVIDDVITGVREFFMDEGVDEQVLNELKLQWELKLKTTQAVEVPAPDPEPEPPALKPQLQPSSVIASTQGLNIVNPSNHSNKTVSIQISLPAATSNNEARLFTLDVPHSAMSGDKLQKVLTAPLITATMALPANLASSLLQQHMNAAFQEHSNRTVPVVPLQTTQTVQASIPNGTTGEASQLLSFSQQDGVPQVDGVRDSSDEEDAEDDDNEDDDENEDDDKDEDDDPDAADENNVEEDPLNSGDDVSEDDPTDMFETDNVVVCQYDKITRSRNKWKFYLKDGIMNLGGKDFVFQKSSGDAEW